MATYKVFVQAGSYSGHSDVFNVFTDASLAQIETALSDEWIVLHDADGDSCLVRTDLIWRVQDPGFVYEEN